jgi:hypothetical protein
MRFDRDKRTTLNVPEVAKAYGISRETAYQQADALGCVRIGKRIVFPVAKVAAQLGISANELLARCDAKHENGSQ